MSYQNFMIYSLYFLVFMYGASIASFVMAKYFRENLNADSDKIRDKDKNILKINNKRSYCDGCEKSLKWYELIPVFSSVYIIFFSKFYKKCCNLKLNKEYFLYEFLFGIFSVFLFYFLLLYLSLHLSLFLTFILMYFITDLTYNDLKSKEVSSIILFVFFTFSLLYFFIYLFINKFLPDIYINLLITLFTILPLSLIYIISKGRAMGLADPIYFASIALIFNTINLNTSINILLYSIWSGAILSILYMYIKYRKYTKGLQMPFLPFVTFGLFILLISNYYFIDISYILNI